MRLMDLPDDVLSFLMTCKMGMTQPTRGSSKSLHDKVRDGSCLAISIPSLFNDFVQAQSTLGVREEEQRVFQDFRSLINRSQDVKALNIECTSLTVIPLLVLVTCQPPLSVLNLSGSGISSTSLEAVVQGFGKGLKALTLDEAYSVESNVVNSIADCCGRLQSLHLKKTVLVCGKSLVALFGKLKHHLECVELDTVGDESVDDRVLFALSECTSLVDVTLRGLHQITEIGVNRIVGILGTQLTGLTIDYCANILPTIAHSIEGFSSGLRKLHLSFSIGDLDEKCLKHHPWFNDFVEPQEPSAHSAGLEPPYIPCKMTLTELWELKIRCYCLTDTFVIDVFQFLPSCRKISLRGCEDITDKSLLQLSCAAPSLQFLDVSFIPSVSDDGLRYFLSYVPLLTHLYAYGCSNITDLTLTETVPRYAPELREVAFSRPSLLAEELLRERNISVVQL